MEIHLVNEEEKPRSYPAVSFFAFIISTSVFTMFKESFDIGNIGYSLFPILIGFSISFLFLLYTSKTAYSVIVKIDNRYIRILKLFILTIGAGIAFGFLSGGMYGIFQLGIQ